VNTHVVSSTEVRAKPETPERWAKALERAIANGVEPLQIAGTGEWVVTSASKLGTVYRTDGFACECDAALHGDGVCQHRAVVRFVLGLLTLPQQEPAAMPMTLTTIDCGACHGRGWNYVETNGGRAFPEQVACRRCVGTGQVPVRIQTLTPAPALAAD
jgi:hypothetical protein